MLTVLYDRGKAVCPKCKGMLSYDARMKERLPLGFGFTPASHKFQVDCLVRSGFRGECMECGTVVFAVKSQRHSTSFPKSINQKLKVSLDIRPKCGSVSV